MIFLRSWECPQSQVEIHQMKGSLILQKCLMEVVLETKIIKPNQPQIQLNKAQCLNRKVALNQKSKKYHLMPHRQISIIQNQTLESLQVLRKDQAKNSKISFQILLLHKTHLSQILLDLILDNLKNQKTHFPRFPQDRVFLQILSSYKTPLQGQEYNKQLLTLLEG